MAQKESIAAVMTKLYDILVPLESAERQRAITAALTLLGETEVSTIAPPAAGGDSEPQCVGGTDEMGDAKSFFDAKEPRSKMEELAVAAAFREQSDNHEHSKSELEEVIKAARRNFDSGNFARDIANAKTKGLFNKGDGNRLSYYGQHYVDAMPDRAAVKAIRKPKGA